MFEHIICSTCGLKKLLSDFYTGRKQCKVCVCKRVRLYQETNGRSVQSCRKAYSKKYREQNKDKVKAGDKKYKGNNKKKIQEYREANREKARLYAIDYRLKNREKAMECQKKYKNKQRSTPKYKLNHNISSAIRKALTGNKAGRTWESLVGYTIEELREHLEGQFTEDMSWGNYGKNGWEIDHIIPRTVFNYTHPEHKDFRGCWSLKNLRPLWRADNIAKGAGLIKHFQPSLLLS